VRGVSAAIYHPELYVASMRQLLGWVAVAVPVCSPGLTIWTLRAMAVDAIVAALCSVDQQLPSQVTPGQCGIALADQGQERLARHEQRASEPLRPPLVERPLLEPVATSKAYSAKAQAKRTSARPSSRSASCSSVGCRWTSSAPDQGDRPTVVADQLHTASRRAADLRPPGSRGGRLDTPPRRAWEDLGGRQSGRVRTTARSPAQRAHGEA
jgi:hypothetical protein